MGRRGLGRGLSALIATGESVGGLKFEELPISAIRPNSFQPRRNFPEAGIRELAASIREVGILQPLVVRSTERGFELIAGERRLRAAKEAGLERVPVLIRQAGTDESMELALVENLQREDLNPLETAAAYQALMDSFGLTKEQLAMRLGKSRAAVTNTLRLVQLPERVRTMLQDGKLSEGHARALLSLKSEEDIVRLANRIHAEKLSVRKTEELVRRILSGGKGGREDTASSSAKEARGDEEYAEATRMIQEKIELPVRIKPSRRGGKLEIRFRNREQLEAIVSLLTSN
ncbi:Stage 0 sporulation protein J [Rubrobacter xylanophilus DSM 9941]|uniref:ParB/RepB/Spo0J family partition protein n=1 Tax=Rubrobacter xylanophilus TaxID=49319 RepID=UPI001C63BE20|nr:ParB/RepB/Spo0J family partition protein [Rubrobacter xylanophilus]QYJ16194.1 Stage 0 sporulation protein J [Rubrobacter xylanophilus DSM 9941]